LLQLTTASEYYPGDRQMILCRLRGKWTFLARALFWSMAGVELIAIGFLGRWWACSSSTLPLIAWRLNLARGICSASSSDVPWMNLPECFR
jgi:hypothetical protein